MIHRNRKRNALSKYNKRSLGVDVARYGLRFRVSMAFEKSKKKETNYVPDGHRGDGLFVENVLIVVVIRSGRSFSHNETVSEQTDRLVCWNETRAPNGGRRAREKGII